MIDNKTDKRSKQERQDEWDSRPPLSEQGTIMLIEGPWRNREGNQRTVTSEVTALEQRVERLEEALYEAIEVGGAPESTWVDTDDETRRAWPISNEEALAAEEEA